MEKALCRQITFYVTIRDTASAEPFPDNRVLTLSNRRQASASPLSTSRIENATSLPRCHDSDLDC
jgi:hypothetical protein